MSVAHISKGPSQDSILIVPLLDFRDSAHYTLATTWQYPANLP